MRSRRCPRPPGNDPPPPGKGRTARRCPAFFVWAVPLVLALLFSLCFVAAETDHRCSGEHCAVCRQIHACQRLPEQLDAAPGGGAGGSPPLGFHVRCGAIADALCAIDPQHQEGCRENAACIRKPAELDSRYQAVVDSASTRTLLFAGRFPFRYPADDHRLDCYAAFSGCPAAALRAGLSAGRPLCPGILPCPQLTFRGRHDKILLVSHH